MSGPVVPVPAGTRAGRCSACHAEVYWVEMPSGRKMPVDCAGDVEARPPTAEEPGQGISHFATCPFADQFRRARPRRR